MVVRLNGIVDQVIGIHIPIKMPISQTDLRDMRDMRDKRDKRGKRGKRGKRDKIDKRDSHTISSHLLVLLRTY
jgi:hypothetical protein